MIGVVVITLGDILDVLAAVLIVGIIVVPYVARNIGEAIITVFGCETNDKKGRAT